MPSAPLISEPEQPSDPERGAAPAFTYTVSVRSLCEFTAKRGDLDRRFTPSATALEGQMSQATVVGRRGLDYESEIALAGKYQTLRVRGRADGYDPRRHCLEEIKAIRGHPDDVPGNRKHLHWAQLETYGALFCRTRGLDEVHLALVYVDVATQSETVLRQLSSASDLEAAFQARCQQFLAWSQQETAHRTARDAGLAELPFPPGEFRPGQHGLAAAVYRAAVQGRCLLAQAPTGIGKTIGTLYPLLRAMPARQLDKIGYLTCKGTGRLTALAALEPLREALPGQSLRVLTLVAKDQACEHPDKACHGESCPLARGFYDRLPAARAEAVDAGWLDPPAQRAVALRHGICPYYLGHELLRWVDVVVGDVHHAFDPHGQLFGLAQALDWRLGLLVDEAHNLLDRARQMYSASLSLGQIRAAMDAAPSALRAPFKRLWATVHEAAAGQESDYKAHETVPEALDEPLRTLNAAVGDHLQQHPAVTGVLLSFYFEALKLQRGVDRFGPHSIFDIERRDVPAPAARPSGPRVPRDQATLPLLDEPDTAPSDTGHAAGTVREATLSVRNVVPGAFLRPRFEALQTVTLFSATLGPEAYLRNLLGLPDVTAWIDVPPAFPPEHLCVRIADRLSTRYPHRQASLDAVVDLMARQFAEQPGNYLAFFSSFDYLEQAAARLAERVPSLPQWRQSRAMHDASRREFLARFMPHGAGIGFVVLGGAFAEGVDLPGKRLIGAFIATLGLPPVSPVQEQFRQRLDALFGPGHGYADRVPGLQKVVQAAGRVIRTPEDRGWLWLLDDRYRQPEVRGLLPAWWGLGGTQPVRTRSPG